MPGWQGGNPVNDPWSARGEADSYSPFGDAGAADRWNNGGGGELSLANATDVPDSSSNSSTHTPFCVYLVIHTIGGTEVGIWDLVLLIPNALFLLYLVSTMCHSARRLKQVSSPVYNTFYVLIFLTCVMGTVRCATTMSVKGFNSVSDRVLWLTLRFFQLSTELSVLILGLLFGHLDSRRSIQRVLIITITLSLAYVFTQGVLQQMSNGEDLLDHNVYAHGGVPFWFGSSLLFLLVYVSVVLLRYIPSLNCCGLIVPVKAKFYYYALFMAILNLLQSVGSGLILFTDPDASEGFCLIDVTTFFLFSLFSPIIYTVFLWGFFKPSFTSSSERSHLLDISYNSPGEFNPRTSIISNAGGHGSTNNGVAPVMGGHGTGIYGSSAPKDIGSYPLSYNSLASSLDAVDGDLKDEMLDPEKTRRAEHDVYRSPSTETTRSYGFRTPLERSFVDNYDSEGSLNRYSDTDLSDFEDLS
eukprot:scpid67801/ scgid18271/ Transmembrane protein adipocyte-associated 1 homolog; Integral membrane protein GPR175